MTAFPLTADKPEYNPQRHSGGKWGSYKLCPNCPKLQECQERVKIGMWVCCEIPDELDLMRVEIARA